MSDSDRTKDFIKTKTTIYGIIIAIIIIIYGIVGSHFLMDLDLFDSIYYTIITLATVGYGDIIPITTTQKIFSVTLALAGVGILAYILSIIISSITENLHDLRSGRSMKKKLSKIENHYILCGYGRVGTAVLDELMKRKQKAIVIEIDEDKTEEIEENDNIIVLHADATDDKTLKKLNIEKSLGVIVTTGSDVDNLFIVLTSRELCEDAWIVSRASTKENINRLTRAGANKVISPETIGGSDIYFAAAKPNLVRITEKHNVEFMERELEILRKHDCHIEKIEYHLPGIKKPIERDNDTSIKQEDYFINKVKTDPNVRESLETMYNIVNNVHSHILSGPDQTNLNNAIEELKKEGIVLGINLDSSELNELTAKHKNDKK